MKRIAILQSNYIPWKGYFDMIAYVDEFIIYDDMQYTKNDWRNRNKIKTPSGSAWLTIPVGNDLNRTIREVVIKDKKWREKHCKTLQANYGKAPFFNEIYPLVSEVILNNNLDHLSQINIELIIAICSYLGINTKISYSWEYGIIEGKTERLIDLCKKAQGSTYVSGPAAKDYVDSLLFEKANLNLEWFNYHGYPEYPQLWGAFEHSVSILDLLFNCGKNSYKYMRYVNAPI